MAVHDHIYIAIDLKSFYASVECVSRCLDPLTTNLVVADASRTEKTICLAVSPSLKAFGISGRPRLFEVVERVREINAERRCRAPKHRFVESSCNANELATNPSLELAYITATPRMARYLQVSSDIYGIYLKYVSPEDIHVYSIDEVFLDATQYLHLYQVTAREFAVRLIREVLQGTGITATAGIGSNLFLAKVAMDIVAKHKKADKDGVRIAQLDEMSYRKILWTHEPLTDFWRVGPGIQRRLAKYNIHTMGDIARFSLRADGTLYDEFGINAELLIDHAWGYEPCTMKDIKRYVPSANSLGAGQVLMEPYTYEKAMVVCKEMIDNLCLDLVDKNLVAEGVGLYINYDASSDLSNYKGKISVDYYGRRAPKPAGGSMPLKNPTSSVKVISDAILSIFKQTVDKSLLIRRINVTATRVVPKSLVKDKARVEQFSLFADPESTEKRLSEEKIAEKKEEDLAKAILNIKHRFGKNAILKGTNYEEGATGKERNEQIGGHRE
jgi:DNA polymerase V